MNTTLVALCCLLAQPGPKFLPHTVDGPLPAGTLESLALDGDFQLSAMVQPLPTAKLLSLVRDGIKVPALLNQHCLLLTNGDRWPLDPKTVPRVEEEKLFVRLGPPMHSAQRKEVSVPLILVQAWVRQAEGVHDDVDLLLHLMQTGRRVRDQAILKSGDRIEGNLDKLDGKDRLRFQTNGQETTVSSEDLALLAWNTDRQIVLRAKKPVLHVALVGGGRCNLVGTSIDQGKNLVGMILGGGKVEIPLQGVAALHLRYAKAVYLSELIPDRYEHTPFVGLSWGLKRDANVTGRPMIMDGHTYDKGLGMHTQSKVTYKWKEKFKWFEATVGVDERSGGEGRARLALLVGQERHDLTPQRDLTGKEPPLKVRVDVSAVRELTLFANFGDRGDILGRVNWGDARLVRE